MRYCRRAFLYGFTIDSREKSRSPQHPTVWGGIRFEYRAARIQRRSLLRNDRFTTRSPVSPITLDSDLFTNDFIAERETFSRMLHTELRADNFPWIRVLEVFVLCYYFHFHQNIPPRSRNTPSLSLLVSFSPSCSLLLFPLSFSLSL